jgi:murein DD-endopeptidase MepM/ murein hydrolase activator NlpD
MIINTVIAIVLAGENGSEIGGVKESIKPVESIKESITESTPESEKKPENENESSKPTDTKIIFTLPVSSGTVIKNYTSSTVVFNQTLGVYTGHMGIDFGAEAGTAVLCAYAGKIESITSAYLQGTTITVDHGNGLKTVYNSIEADEDLKEGQTVTAGQTLGFVSDNNRQEYKDGPHLHFEVILNGERVDPLDYLMMNEK